MLHSIAEPPPGTKRREERVETLKRILENSAIATANGDFESIAVQELVDHSSDADLDVGERRWNTAT